MKQKNDQTTDYLMKVRLPHFASLLKEKTARQTSVLFSSHIVLILITMLTGVINTRYLGPEGYGIYCFALSFISFLGIFFGFGLTSAAARLIALAPNQRRERELIATSIFAGMFVSLAFSQTVFISSFIVDHVFSTNVKPLIAGISVIAAALPFQTFITQICRGANRIGYIAIFNVIPKLWYLLTILIAIATSTLNPLVALFLSLGGIFVTSLIIAVRLKPRFNNLRNDIALLLKETKKYGFNVYLGSIADTTTYRLDKLFIASFVNTTSVGFYALSTTIVSPMVSLSTSLSVSLFKQFTNEQAGIDRKVILFNAAWLAFCLLFLLGMGKLIVVTLFSHNFLPAVPLIAPLALAGFFQGMYQPFNMFLNAKGKGKELRLTAFVEAVFNVIGNFVFIYFYGAMGAAIASAIAKGIELALNVYFYRKTQENRGKI